MYNHDMQDEENQYYLGLSMDTIMSGLQVEYFGTESKRSIKKMKIACESVLGFYNSNLNITDGDSDIQFAKMLLAEIGRDCPEHLI